MSIDIPSSVTTIINDAFIACTSLVGINVDASNAVYRSIDGVLFDKNTATLIAYPANRRAIFYAIPSSVTTIEGHAFNSNARLVAVTIPSSVTKLSSVAFNKCSQLKVINVDAANAAFSSIDGVVYDKSATTLVLFPPMKAEVFSIPDGVKKIGDGAFCDNNRLVEVRIPHSVGVIGSYAFSNCRELTSVEGLNYVSWIGEYAFQDNYRLASIDIASAREICEGAFLHCGSIRSLIVPSGLHEVGEYTFYQMGTRDVYLYTSPFLKGVGLKTFDCDTFHVRKGYREEYEKEGCWSFMCRDIVDDLELEYIRLDKESYRVAINRSVDPVVSYSPKTASAPELVWTSSDESVLYVDPLYGMCRGLKEGIAYVTVAVKNESHLTATAKIYVGAAKDPVPCATPTIALCGDKLHFACCTAGATFTGTYELVMPEGEIPASGTFSGPTFALPSLMITVVANAPGHLPSDPAILTLEFGKGDLNGDGIVSISDLNRLIQQMLGM